MTVRWAKWLRGGSTQELGVACAILVLASVISVANPEFLALENALELVSNYAFVGILAAGLLVVLVSGEIDISFIAIATVAQYLMAASIVRWGGNPPHLAHPAGRLPSKCRAAPLAGVPRGDRGQPRPATSNGWEGFEPPLSQW